METEGIFDPQAGRALFSSHDKYLGPYRVIPDGAKGIALVSTGRLQAHYSIRVICRVSQGR
jgi:hypothetical protein